MTKVEKFVPELRESKDIESLEEMNFEYDVFDIEHLYQFCEENPINKAKKHYEFMKLERTKELDDVVREIWDFWHMPVDQMQTYFGMSTQIKPETRGLKWEDLFGDKH